MGQRLRALTLLVVLIGAGTLLGSALAQWWQAPRGVSEVAPVPRPEGRVRVEVLNGGGIQGIARSATRALRDSGFDVVYYGNAENFSLDSSVVLDRVGRLDFAEGVAEVLGIRDVRTQLDSSLYLEVTVHLGGEWPTGDPWGQPREDSIAGG
ncbi:LytR C-terminal domain-containing protein [Gemmatimonadota bacterium]